VADDHRAQLARLRACGRELRAEFAFVEGEYRAGRLSLSEEVALLTDITREMTPLTPGAVRRGARVAARRDAGWATTGGVRTGSSRKHP
jgi:hypothetical protein